MAEPQRGRFALTTGAVAAVLASACCLGPLILVTLGLGGAWVGQLTALEPYRPLFIGVSLIALVLAYWRIFRSKKEACAPEEVCALPQVSRVYKIVFWVVAVLVLVALGFPYVLPLFY